MLINVKDQFEFLRTLLKIEGEIYIIELVAQEGGRILCRVTDSLGCNYFKDLNFDEVSIPQMEQAYKILVKFPPDELITIEIHGYPNSESLTEFRNLLVESLDNTEAKS